MPEKTARIYAKILETASSVPKIFITPAWIIGYKGTLLAQSSSFDWDGHAEDENPFPSARLIAGSIYKISSVWVPG